MGFVRRWWLAGMVGMLAACGGGDAVPPAEVSGDPAELTYAPELNVDLGAMSRAPSGLYTRDVREGDGAAASRGSEVTVHYTGWLSNGEQFDSSREQQPFSFRLGSGEVIQGWDEGVEGMRVGGRRRLVIPPALAYGEQGAGGVIPPGATLVFDVELLEVR
jgi:peptidylprolyl isomerase